MELCIPTLTVPNSLKYQFSKDFNIKLSDQCCKRMKKIPVHNYEKESGKSIAITGMRAEEGGMRTQLSCILEDSNGHIKKFHPLVKVDENFETWFLEKYDIKLCKLYYPPFNFKRTGCKFCPFALDLENQIEVGYRLLPQETKQAEIIWKPVFDEYRKLNYRLKSIEQIKLF